MKHIKTAGMTRLATGLLAASLVAGVTHADGNPENTQLLKRPLATVEGQEMLVNHFDFPSGFISPSHYHTGHLVVYILEGTGSIEVDGTMRSGGPGEFIEEVPGKVMMMRNESDSERLRFVVFQVGPEGVERAVNAD